MRPKVLKKPTGHPNFNNLFSITLIINILQNNFFVLRKTGDSVRQVVTNLLVNSIKYGNQNGTTKVSFYDMDKKILIEVSDNGIGIEEQHLKHLFDRFYRVDSSRSRKQGGSGLGLSIVKHIIEAHGQSIKVRSTPNIGTTFGFTLNKTKKKTNETPETRSLHLL